MAKEESRGNFSRDGSTEQVSARHCSNINKTRDYFDLKIWLESRYYTECQRQIH